MEVHWDRVDIPLQEQNVRHFKNTNMRHFTNTLDCRNGRLMVRHVASSTISQTGVRHTHTAHALMSRYQYREETFRVLGTNWK